MTKQDIIDYVVESPTNTNKAVLSTMLNQFAVGDNKQEIELLAQENKVYTPAEGKVYNKVTVNVPGKTEVALSATENTTYTPAEGTVYNSVTVNVPANEPVIPNFSLASIDENNYSLTSTVAYSTLITNDHGMCTINIEGYNTSDAGFYQIVNNLTEPNMTKSIMVTRNMGHKLGNGVDYNSYPLMFRNYCAAPGDSVNDYVWYLKAIDIRDVGSIE